MITCPPGEMLLDLLHGALPADSASAVRLHVEGCGSCLDALDRLTDDPDLAHWIEAGLGDRGRPALRAAISGVGPDGGGRPRALGGYEIEAEVGRGGMGVVYRARDRALDRVVALKVLRPDLDDDRARRRFVREVRAAAAVEHDHIVRVYATSDPAEEPLFFAMEFVGGPSLSRRIRAEGRLAPREAAELVAQAADGLAAAHAAGLVHRDVKPDNILIDAATGRAKVGDFGLARLAADPSDLTRSGVVAGTPAYLSPEQARGDAHTGAPVDVYGLGVTLYECLTGEVPFLGAPHMVVQQILHDDPRPPRRLNDAIPRDLETICLKAMAREPHRRYASAGALAADLRRWLAGEPIRARAVGPIERGWRLARRRPLSASLAAALAIALVAGTTTSVVLWRRAEANLRAAGRDYRRARDAVDKLYVKLYTNGLLNQPALQAVRTEIARDAVAYYREFLRDHGDDPALRADAARASYASGKLMYDTGDRREALDSLRQAEPLLEELGRAEPGDLSHRFDAARCKDLIAVLTANLGLGPEALAAHGRAVAAYRDLAAADPGNPRWRRMVGHALGNLANTHYSAGRIEAARAIYQQARAQFQSLLDTDPGNADYRRDLALTLHNLAQTADLADRPALLREALAIREALAAQDTATEYERRNVARTREKLGWCLHASGRDAEALPLLVPACDELRRISRGSPDRVDYALDLAEACKDRAAPLLALGRPAEALASAAEALESLARPARVRPGEPVRPGAPGQFPRRGRVRPRGARPPRRGPPRPTRGHVTARAPRPRAARRHRRPHGTGRPPQGDRRRGGPGPSPRVIRSPSTNRAPRRPRRRIAAACSRRRTAHPSRRRSAGRRRGRGRSAPPGR